MDFRTVAQPAATDGAFAPLQPPFGAASRAFDSRSAPEKALQFTRVLNDSKRMQPRNGKNSSNRAAAASADHPRFAKARASNASNGTARGGTGAHRNRMA